MATTKRKKSILVAGKIHIVQIWQNTDMRKGEFALRKILNEDRTLFPGQIVIFRNRARDRIKVLGHTKGMYSEYAGDKCTFDFELYRDHIVKAVGDAFGLKLFLPKDTRID